MVLSFINKSNFWKIFIPAVCIAFSTTLLCSLFCGSNSIYTWRALKNKKTEMEAELAALNTERTHLSREIRLLKNDPSYVEKVIRQRLNFVKQNEILYIFEEDAPDSFWDGGVNPSGTKKR